MFDYNMVSSLKETEGKLLPKDYKNSIFLHHARNLNDIYLNSFSINTIT